MKILQDLFDLIFPRPCCSCGRTLLRQERYICLDCYLQLPRTYYHCDGNNALFQQFWGLVPIEMAASFLFFNKNGHTQAIIHRLKYKHSPELGIFLGEHYGHYLSKSSFFKDIDAIIPVPLHPKKLRKRGYNQSSMIAQGLSLSLGKPIWDDVLFRVISTATQTKKTRLERWQNVSQAFEVRANSAIRGQHVLLVDDVITTGATIEVCARNLIEIAGLRVSVVSLAIPTP